MLRVVESRRSNILDELFANYQGSAFDIRLWDGWRWSSSAAERPACTLVINNPQALALLIVEPNEISLGDAFVNEDIEVEGDLFSVFSIAKHILDRPASLHQKLLEGIARTLFGMCRRVRFGAPHSMRRDQASIAYHYDQPVAFYRPWLGPSLAYSCAYFRSPKDPLDQAQTQKLELICRKLRLQPYERFLDIGCGWGSLVLHAAAKHHARAHGITLSREQAAVTRQRIESAGLEQRCDVKLLDYRRLNSVPTTFDKIASVGMYEHVGLENLPRYFRTVRSLLRPGGAFLNHGIARSATSPSRKASFIERYIFPDGRLVTLNETIHAAESEGLEVRDVENLRAHYELTLRKWVESLRRNSEETLKYVPMTTYRMWLLYMAGCAAAFHRGDIAVYQVIFGRTGDTQAISTREDWYASDSRLELKASVA